MCVIACRYVLVALCALVCAPALSCELLVDRGAGPEPVRLAGLGPGIAGGELACGPARQAAQVWTLAVDPQKSALGIRDDPLFSQRFTGPLSEVIALRIENDVRLTVFERTSTVGLSRSLASARRDGYRRFATFCDAAPADPLDCSVKGVRLKVRVTFEHADNDGYLDTALHEISYYDGAAKLHVISIVTPYVEGPMANINVWVAAIYAVSDVLSSPAFVAAE